MERVINKVSFIYFSCGSPASRTQFIKKSTFSWIFFVLPNELDYQQVKLQPKRLPCDGGSIWISGEQVLVIGEEMLPSDPQGYWRQSTFRRFGKVSILLHFLFWVSVCYSGPCRQRLTEARGRTEPCSTEAQAANPSVIHVRILKLKINKQEFNNRLFVFLFQNCCHE